MPNRQGRPTLLDRLDRHSDGVLNVFLWAIVICAGLAVLAVAILVIAALVT